MKPPTPSAWALLLAALIVLMCGTARAGESLALARELYASAAYDDALAAIAKLRASGVATDTLAVEQVRAFCLLALGRTTEAQAAIETIVVADPAYHPSDADVSPRIRTAFTDARRRLLPAIVQQQYAQSKAAYDRKEYGSAAAGFTTVLTVLADPDLSAAASQPPLADLRTLALGFQELSARAAAPPPLPTPPPLELPPAQTPPPAAAPLRIYTAGDRDVVPPVAERQELPPFTAKAPTLTVGSLEVVIDERGRVESATMRDSVNAMYDRLALTATTTWRYRPATLDGVPVKFRKVLQISIKPTP